MCVLSSFNKYFHQGSSFDLECAVRFIYGGGFLPWSCVEYHLHFTRLAVRRHQTQKYKFRIKLFSWITRNILCPNGCKHDRTIPDSHFICIWNYLDDICLQHNFMPNTIKTGRKTDWTNNPKYLRWRW